MKVAVVIPCHNYARFLGECLDSVLAQTHAPAEIVVVDDSSTDNCKQIAESRKGVRYIRVEHRSAMKSRLSGMQATNSEFLCFLDADDTLPANYLEYGLKQFEEQTGIVYSDLARFGSHSVYKPLNYDPETIQQENTLHSGCLVRRAALEATMALEQNADGQHAMDWATWKRVVEAGWKVEKNPVPYNYRQHAGSMSHVTSDERADRGGYYNYTMRNSERVTLFVPLSGRWRTVERFREFLENQTLPRELVSLVLLDTSGNEKFSRMVRSWVAQCDYQDVRHCLFDLKLDRGLADHDRFQEAVKRQVQLAASRIYTKMKQMVETEYVWIVEDDVIPPYDAGEKLLFHMGPKVAAVSGAYQSRYHNCYIAWTDSRHLRGGRGVEQVSGTGFGCLMLRKSILDQAVITHRAKTGDYDPNFFDWLSRYKGGRYKVLLNWDMEAEHLEGNTPRVATDLESLDDILMSGMPLIGGRAGLISCEDTTDVLG